MKNILILILVFVSTNAFTQKQDSIPKKDQKSVKLLVSHLIEGASSETEKVERIYEWITASIDYDYSKVNSDKPLENVQVDKVLSSKKAICGEYCNLMQAMLKEANIKSEIINGYVQTTLKDSMIVPISDRHAWIAINVEGEWFLADPTWDSGYLGNIKTDKDEKYAKKNESLEKKYTKKSDKLSSKLDSESDIDKQNKLNIKIEDVLVKEKEAQDDLKKKEKNAKVFTGKIGFVSDPKKDWFLIHSDSFLLRHLPLNPIWQLKTDTISINVFSQGHDSIVNRVKKTSNTAFDYKSQIELYESLDFLERLLWDAEIGNQYSRKNSQVKALNYYNYLSVLTNKKAQKVAPPKYKIYDFSTVSHLVDTTKAYSKLAKKESKENYSYFKKAYTKLYKEDLKMEKLHTKMQSKLVVNHDKIIDKIDSRNDKLESQIESLNSKTEKLSDKSSEKSFYADTVAVKYLTDSLTILVQNFKIEKQIWVKATDSTFLQPLIDTMLYSMYLYRIRNLYVEYQDYELNNDLFIIDSTLIVNNAKMNSIYLDSLPIEMLSKTVYNSVNDISSFTRYAKLELEQLELNSEIRSAEKILENFNHVLLNHYNELITINSRAIEHNVWVSKTLSEFESYLDKMHGFIKKQEQISEARFDYYMNINENDFNRDEKLFEIIEKSCAKWKVEFKEDSK